MLKAFRHHATACILLLLCLTIGISFATEEPLPLRHDAAIAINRQVFMVELATTPEQQQRGLQGRSHVPRGEGMAFVFREPTNTSFWMKGCKAALDLVFIKGSQVVFVAAEMPPCLDSEDTLCPEITAPVTYDTTVELSAGEAARHGIQRGSIVQWLWAVPRGD